MFKLKLLLNDMNNWFLFKTKEWRIWCRL